MRFVCQYCKRYKDDGSGNVQESHGVCAKCLFASYTHQGWMSDSSAVAEVEDAVRRKAKEELLGDFQKYFADECYAGFDEFVGRVLGGAEAEASISLGKKL